MLIVKTNCCKFKPQRTKEASIKRKSKVTMAPVPE